MPLSVIIVNYKTPAMTLDCVSYVLHDSGFQSGVEIIVVDNNSGDGIEQLLKNQYPQVKFIQMGSNAGFARANNAAMRISASDCFLLLNNDTIPTENVISHCYDRFMQSDDVACGIQLLNPDGTPQISGYYAVRGGLNILLQLPYTGQLIKRLAGMANMKKPNVPEASGLIEVDWIMGAFLMVKKTAIEKAGLMDEDFFLYAEEAEWCSRLKKQGKLCIYGDLKMVHLQGESALAAFGSNDRKYSNIFDKKGLQILLSGFVRIRKEFGVGWFIVNLIFFMLNIPVFCMGLLLTKIFGNKSSYDAGMLRGYIKNVWRIAGFSRRIISNKPFFYKVM